MYQVIAPEFKGSHTCWSRREALSWMSQYPATSPVIVTCFGRVIAERS